MFSIGGVKIEEPVLLAPLAGITNSPFRLMAKDYGAGLVYSEMICANGIFHKNRSTYRIAHFEDAERPVALQIFGDIPENMAEAARFVDGLGPDIIDINMGCPQAKIAKRGKGAGAALMQRPAVMEKVVKAVVGATDRPVTVKIRAGWSKDNAVEVAKNLQDMGVLAVAVHPRLGVQRFTGRADWKVITRVKEAVDIPVIGSGDLLLPPDCARMIEETGCDAVMMARGIRGAPWNIQNAIGLIKGGEQCGEPDLEQKIDVLKRLSEGIREYYGTTARLYGIKDDDSEGKALREMRKFVHWFFKGVPKWILDREGLLKLKGFDEYYDFLDLQVEKYGEYLKRGKSERGDL